MHVYTLHARHALDWRRRQGQNTTTSEATAAAAAKKEEIIMRHVCCKLPQGQLTPRWHSSSVMVGMRA